MKNFKPFGPSIGKSKISRKFLEKLNIEVDTKIFSIIYKLKKKNEIHLHEKKSRRNFYHHRDRSEHWGILYHHTRMDNE